MPGVWLEGWVVRQEGFCGCVEAMWRGRRLLGVWRFSMGMFWAVGSSHLVPSGLIAWYVVVYCFELSSGSTSREPGHLES